MPTTRRGAYTRAGAANADAEIFAAAQALIRSIPVAPTSADMLASPTIGKGVGWDEMGTLVVPDWVEEAHPSLYALREIEPLPPRPWRRTARPTQLPPKGDDWLYWVIMSGRGWGKALALSTPLPSMYTDPMLPHATRVGWRSLGDIVAGDTVFDESGRPCKVTATFDRTPQRAYRVTFSDGTHIDACDEHQWVTWTHAERKAYLRSQHEPDVTRFPAEWPSWRAKRLPSRQLLRDDVELVLAKIRDGWSIRRAAAHVGISRQILRSHIEAGHYVAPQPKSGPSATGPRVRTTQEIADTLTHGGRGDTNHAIPTCGPVELPDADLPIDPWLLGYWLGNGSAIAAQVSSDIRDAKDVERKIRSAGYVPTVRLIREHGTASFGIPGGLRRSLINARLMADKHVPDDYLWASIEQREAMLRGFMDSDGYCDPDSGQVEFCSVRRNLADAVVQLARSLGQKPILGVGRAMLNGVDHGEKYRVTWRPTRNPFSVPRKADRVRPEGAQSLRNHHRMIVSVEPIEPVPMRCLTVDSPHHMYLAGEAMIPTHNTHVGSNVLAEWATTTRGDYAMIAPTFGDARKICTEGPSGLVAALGPQLHHYNKSDYVLYLTNGSRIVLASADAPDRLRGYNLSGAWCDELASFGPEQKELWDKSLIPALRIGKHPRMIITTTPRRSAIVLRELLARAKNGDPSVHLTTGSTFENRANLSAAFLQEMELRYKGTTVGRQELAGEMLDEVEGALVTQATIEATRVLDGNLVPTLRRVVVGVDPCVTAGESSDACGIVVAGLGAIPMRGWTGTKSEVEGPHLYYFQDATMRGTPRRWARRALEVADEWAADSIVIETNQGGDLCTTMLRMVATELEARTPRIKKVHASVGKRTRAEPVAGMFEQYRAHMVGGIPGVEDGFTSWVPGDDTSPNELDAAVWAAVGLLPQLAMKGPAPVRLIA